MEATLAVIASLFAIVQGGVWLINGIQKHRARRILETSGPYGFQPMAASDPVASTSNAVAANMGSTISGFPSDRGVQEDVIPIATPKALDRTLEPDIPSPPAETMTTSASQAEVVEYLQSRNSFVRFVRGFWHVLIMLFLPVFAFLSPLGLAVLLLYPFRNSIANTSLYDDGTTLSLVMGLVLLVPGVFAFKHRPVNAVHKWIRRVCLVFAVLLAVLFVCVYAFTEPT